MLKLGKTNSDYILYFLINISYMCCTNKQVELENSTIKNYNRNLQTELDIERSQKQKLQNTNSSLKEQRDKCQIQMKKQSQKMQAIQEKIRNFKINFHKQLLNNDKKSKECFNKIQSSTQFSQLSFQQISLAYESIESFFSQFSQRQQIIFVLQQVYNLLNGAYYDAQKLIFSVKRYTKLIKQIVTQGYNQKEDQQLILARQFLQTNFSDFFKQLQELVKLNKEKYSKEKSRILEESGIDSNNDELKSEINLQNKVTELEQYIEQIKSEKKKAEQENYRFQNITIPRLREEINKKQTKGFEEIKDTLHKMDNKFIDKNYFLSEIQEMKGQIRSLICSSSNQQMIEIIKTKDIKITQLEKKILQIESKKLSEWSQQTELSNRKKISAQIYSKDKEIQKLNRSLNEQKEALEQISSQMIQRQKRLSNSSVIEENILIKEKQNIYLLSELQKASEKMRNIQKQLAIAEEAARIEKAQIISRLAARQRQLMESKARTKLLLDDNTTQKEKRAIYSSQLTQKERQIQTLKEELASLSSQNQTLSIQIQQILTVKQSFELKNQQFTQLLQNYKINQKSSNQIVPQLPQNENMYEESHILSLQNQFNTQKKQLQKVIDDLKKSNDSLNTNIQKMKKKHLIQLQQRTFAYSSLQLNFTKLQLQKLDLQNQIKTLSKQLKEFRKQAKEKQTLIQFQRNAIEQIENLKISIQKEKKNVLDLQSEVKCLKQLNMKMGQKLNELSTSNQSSRMRSASFVEHRTLFIGDILEKKKVQKKFLMSSIQTVMKQQIEKTVKIYQYKRDKNINPHSFIDGHSNLVIIVQTQKALIAAYYSGQLQSKTPMTQQALIISLDNRKYYQLKDSQSNLHQNRIPKGMVYDQYYIIFGNTQLRIRSGEAKLFSNFGSMSGFFNSKGDKISSLFRDGNNNQVQLINYEIHQLTFSENYIYESL